MSSPAMDTHFKQLQNFKTDYCPSELALYESTRTGMRVAVVDSKGPKVNGYFALATEIHDDSGAPHTLEHLVFMGSKTYRYKGLLDKLATRAYSNTNAWTATDHTAYTLETAGWDGFAQILPVYLEHVLLPTLTDAGCLTEVHHVDGNGHDAGVVYSEMQGTQNDQSELMDLQARRLMYPESIGFRYETGGLMEALRVLSADRIRKFHHDMYQPKNLCLVITGEVDQPGLLHILDKFEDGILDDVPKLSAPFERPWTKAGTAPKLQTSILDVVEFPEDDESMGEILIGFLGPDCTDKLLAAALNVLLIYICGSSVSLLENTIVEKEQLASAVYYSTDLRPDMVIWFTVSGVSTKKLGAVEKRFFSILHDAASEPFDMIYMQDCLHRFKRQLVFDSENSESFFSDKIINDHLFGERDGSNLVELGNMEQFETLAAWAEKDWREFFTLWIAEANHVSILGKPSKKLSKRLKKDEEARVKEQQERLGAEGLKQLKEQLDTAKAENDRPIPPELLKRFEVPSTASIHFIPTITARSGLAREMGDLDNNIQHMINKDKTNLPLFIHFEHIQTNFVRINIVLCTHTIPVELRPLLSLYMMNFFDTPIERMGERIEFEDVVKQLEKDTLDYSIDSGSSVGNSELLRIRMQIEPGKYETAIGWLRDLLIHSIFDQARLKATLAKILADIPEEKRNGNTVLGSVLGMLQYSRESSTRARGTLIKASYLRRIQALLEKKPDEVIAKLEQVRKCLTNPANIRVFVVANLESGALTAPVSSWEHLAYEFDMSNPSLVPLDSQSKCLSPAGQSPSGIGFIVPMHTIDSSFAYLSARGPITYDDPNLPAFEVALAYLNAVEGPLWVAVRGTGLAYGVNFMHDIQVGLLRFHIYRSPDAYRAYVAGRKAVADLATGAVPLDDFAMEGAVSSIVMLFADEQPTMGSAALIGFVNQVVKGIPKDWATEFLKKVRRVTKEDVKKVLSEVMLPVFGKDTADLVVTCAVIMQEGMKEGFEGEGFKVEVKGLDYFKDDYGMGGEDDVDPDGDDEEGEEDGQEEDGDDNEGDNDDDDEGEEEEDDEDDDDDNDDNADEEGNEQDADNTSNDSSLVIVNKDEL